MQLALLQGVNGAARLEWPDVQLIAARMLGPLLSPGCDARDIALRMGLDVCSHGRATVAARGTVYYNDRLTRRERDHRICEVLAAEVLEEGGIATAANIAALAMALTRKTSGSMQRVG